MLSGHPQIDPSQNGEQSGGTFQPEIGGRERVDVGRNAEGTGQSAEGPHHILVAAVIAGVDDADAALPVGAADGAHNVDGRSAFIPGHGRTRLDAHLRVVRLEPVRLEHGHGPRHQRLAPLRRRRPVVVRQQRAFVLHPGAVHAHVPLFDRVITTFTLSLSLSLSQHSLFIYPIVRQIIKHRCAN